ncbi:hypothetical protein J6590_078638 [Homalodisca vitripennis]|nr:hypothetical protein J6590_078638 [Homalodisca vitripennis]
MRYSTPDITHSSSTEAVLKWHLSACLAKHALHYLDSTLQPTLLTHRSPPNLWNPRTVTFTVEENKWIEVDIGLGVSGHLSTSRTMAAPASAPGPQH